MPICIECRHPVSQLFHVLQSRNNKTSAAPTPSNPSHRSSTSSLSVQTSPQKSAPLPRDATATGESPVTPSASSDVRLTQCPNCKRFADKYVEHDNVVIFIDLVLVKPQVYRHVLFNSFKHDQIALDPSIRRLGSLLVLFDVYLTMIQTESLPQRSPPSSILTQNVFVQWTFFLLVCSLATLAQHLLIRWIAILMGYCGSTTESSKKDGASYLATGAMTPSNQTGAEPPKPPTPNAISTALVVSSCMNLFPVLMIVWGANEPITSAEVVTAPTSSRMKYLPRMLLAPARSVGWVKTGVTWAVALQNLEALTTLLGCGYTVGTGLVILGGLVKWMVKDSMMGSVGLN